MSRNPELRLIASKGWVVRATKSLNELLEKPDITVVALNDAIDEFDKRLASFLLIYNQSLNLALRRRKRYLTV